MKKIVIIGAGFSGLSLAHELVKLGLKVDVFEKKENVGGLISSPPTEFGFYETGANGFLNTLTKLFNLTITICQLLYKTKYLKIY